MAHSMAHSSRVGRGLSASCCCGLSASDCGVLSCGLSASRCCCGLSGVSEGEGASNMLVGMSGGTGRGAVTGDESRDRDGGSSA